MSQIKEFVRDSRGYVLMGDSRDFAVAYANRDAVWSWCEKNKITVEYKGSFNETDLWRVRDDKQRVWFALRWSK